MRGDWKMEKRNLASMGKVRVRSTLLSISSGVMPIRCASLSDTMFSVANPPVAARSSASENSENPASDDAAAAPWCEAKPLPVWMMHMSVFLLVFGDVHREAGRVGGDGALRQDHGATQEAQKVCAGVYMGVTTSQLDELAAETAAETAATLRASQPDYASVHSLFRFVSPLPIAARIVVSNLSPSG
ncbi:hypothetical protein ZWY2020_039220 [Hordeum vulgare]|nr:hypothetical protein ZWY2020_039220 [Hordeum vulgare]